MAISEYLDFVIQAQNTERGEGGTARFRAQVSSSPAGWSGPEWRSVPKRLDFYLRLLERRKMYLDEMIDLGERLSSLLLSEWERRLFSDSLDRLESHQGLRVRLDLPPDLAYIPWEYLYIRRGDGQKDINGFLAMNPRVSITRYEASAPSRQADITLEACRLLVVTAEPDAQPTFPNLGGLSDERFEIADAVRGISQIELCYLEDPSLQQLGDTLLHGADLFHFSGHGRFEQRVGPGLGSFEGEGQIVLVTAQGEPEIVRASRLALVLRGNGVRMAVLNSGESARRDQFDAATGLASSLVRANIPAVVGMQYTLRDRSARAFSRRFYLALAAGLPLDRAVVEGRRAISNKCGDDDRDWGVPVLYLQERSLVLKAVADRRDEPSDTVDRRALLKILVSKFRREDLETLCFDIEEDLKNAGNKLEVNLEMVGGTGKEAKARGLIEYLDNRDHLETLVRAVRKARPGSL